MTRNHFNFLADSEDPLSRDEIATLRVLYDKANEDDLKAGTKSVGIMGRILATLHELEIRANSTDGQRLALRLLRIRLDALLWHEEVRRYDPWGEHPMCTACGNSSKRGQIFNAAAQEYGAIYANAKAKVDEILADEEKGVKNDR